VIKYISYIRLFLKLKICKAFEESLNFLIFLGAIFPSSNVDRRESWNPSRVASQKTVDFDFRARLAFDFALFTLNQKSSDDSFITNNVLEYFDGANQIFQITQQGMFFKPKTKPFIILVVSRRNV